MMLLNMSISGGVLILLTAAVRFLAAGRLPKRAVVLLWRITVLRLLIPFDLPFYYGISSPATRAADQALQSARNVSDSFGGAFEWKTAMWLAGAGACILCFSISYYRERQRLSDAIPVSEDTDEILRMLVKIPGRVRILVSDRTTTPLTAGIVFPRIILPKLLKADRGTDFKYVLMHEMIHIKRADNLFKLVMLLAVCIHWFNPLVWVMYLLTDRDIELSCDEKILEICGEEEKKKYARALLELAENQYQWSLFLNGFGKSAIQERIVAIMNFKKMSMAGIVCAILLAGTAMTAFAGNSSDIAKKKEQANIESTENSAVEEGDISYTGQLKSEEGAPEVIVKVNDELTDKYQVKTEQTENGEITVSIFSQTEEADE